MKNLVLGLIALALLPVMYLGITTPVSAQQCFELNAVVALELTDKPGVSFVVIDEPGAVKAALEMFASKGASIPEGVTRILVYKAVGPKGELLALQYGFEVNGCLLPPRDWPIDLLSPVGARLSGATTLGVFA
jgi:hypothetical protein